MQRDNGYPILRYRIKIKSNFLVYTGYPASPDELEISRKRQDFVHLKEEKVLKMVVVYTLPSCVQCESTKKLLNKNDIAYEVVDLSQDEAAMDMVKTLGYQSAPVVVAGDKHWSGFRPDMISSLAA